MSYFKYLILLVLIVGCASKKVNVSYYWPKQDQNLGTYKSKCDTNHKECDAYINLLIQELRFEDVFTLNRKLCSKDIKYCTRSAYEHFYKGDKDKYLSELKKYCKRGDGAACSYHAYYKEQEGLITETDFKKVAKRSCEKFQDSYSCNVHYQNMFKKLGAEGLDGKRKYWENIYLKGCNKKYESMCSSLANHFQKFREHKKAKKYRRLACSYGDKDMCSYLKNKSILMQGGEKAIAIAEKNCLNLSNGNPRSCDYISRLEAQKGNIERSDKFYSLACLKGMRSACDAMARMFQKRNQKDIVTKYRKIACMNGGWTGCFGLAVENIKTDKKAIDKIKGLCSFGHAPSCAYVGYKLGKDGKEEEGAKYVEKGCKDKNAESCWYYGKFLQEKIKAVPKYKPVFEKSCSQDSSNGCLSSCLANLKNNQEDDAKKAYFKSCEIKQFKFGYCSDAKEAGSFAKLDISKSDLQSYCSAKDKFPWWKYAGMGALAAIGIVIVN